VVYHHENGDAFSDRVVFRVTVGRHSIRVRFPILILPLTDRAPSLAAAGSPLVVPRGGFSPITTRNLDVADRKSFDRRQTVFVVPDQPVAGEITKRINPLTVGRGVSRSVISN